MSGKVIWITGLSGAGKSTLAAELISELATLDWTPVLLDGDVLRGVFGPDDTCDKGFSLANRLLLAMRYSRLCKLLSDQGFLVVIATISMFKEVYAWNREHLPNYFEVYMEASLEDLRRRDSKGIYKDYDAGMIYNVAGLDLPIDVPDSPNFVGNIEDGQALKTARKIVTVMKRLEFL